VAPVAFANSSAAAFASSYASPTIRGSLVQSLILAIFAGDTFFGRKIVARAPAANTVRATAKPRLPPEAVTIPATICSGVKANKRFMAPRALNELVT
jgi:hypothetical protein